MAPQELSDNTFDDTPERCPICRQEYQGFCPLNSSACPYDDPADVDDTDEEDEPDFEDVKHVDQLLKEDKEALRLIDEADGEAIPKEVLEEVEADENPKD